MVFFGAIVALAPSAYAQEKMALGGGYQYLHVSNNGTSVNTNGFFVDFTGNLPQKTGMFSWAWIGELTGNYRSDEGGHAYTYSGGGVGSFEANAQVKPFVDIQIGGITQGGGSSNASSDSAFLLWLGGGANLPLKGQKFSVRVKLDYGRAFYSDDHGGGQNLFRLGVGATIPIPFK